MEARCEEGPGITVNSDSYVCADWNFHFADESRVPSEPRPGFFTDVAFQMLPFHIGVSALGFAREGKYARTLRQMDHPPSSKAAA